MPPATVHGSCLCGAVAFEVDAPFLKFVNCLCSRCRKATGSAYASNAVVLPNAFRWLRGEDHVVRFDLSTARSFATCFCRTCGSPLPHGTRSGREVIVPAGAFDDDPQAQPSQNVCWSSRAPWYRHGDDLPTDQAEG